MRWSAIGLAVLTVATACERPPVEPEPRPRGGATAAAASGAPAGGAPTGAAKPKPARKNACIVPLPDKPDRPLVTGADPACPPDPSGRMNLRRMSLVFANGKTIDAEVAEKDRERMRGLMFRTALSDDEGMIFLFPRAKRHRFWMKNTCLPLDMLFVDAHGVIVGIEENVPTLNEDNYFVRCASQYVIEVNAGWSRRHGIKPGDHVIIPASSR